MLLQPGMVEEVRVDHLFRGLSLALYERLYVLVIQSCDEFLEKSILHADAVKTAYARGYEDARREGEKAPAAAVGVDVVQELRKQIKELKDQLAKSNSRYKSKDEGGNKSEKGKKPKKKGPITCYNCKEKGNIARNCPKSNKRDEKSNSKFPKNPTDCKNISN